MKQEYQLRFLGQELWLLPEKAIYWKNQKALILSDLHLGKTGHFRKEGIPLPAGSGHKDYEVLNNVLDRYEVKQMLVVGDLFHSDYNLELILFSQWKKKHPDLHITLIKGNHDILPPRFYSSSFIHVVEEYLEYPPFLFSHEPASKQELYNISGHIHPAVELKGKARQFLTLSCFYFGKQGGLLPAFGNLTGKCRISVQEEDMVFVVTENRVVRMG